MEGSGGENGLNDALTLVKFSFLSSFILATIIVLKGTVTTTNVLPNATNWAQDFGVNMVTLQLVQSRRGLEVRHVHARMCVILPPYHKTEDHKIEGERGHNQSDFERM